MEFFHGIIALLAFGLLVLSGLVTWLYVQQTRLLSAVNSLAIAISTPPPVLPPPEPVTIHKVEEETPVAEVEDDRVSVYEEESVVSSSEEEEPVIKQEEEATAPHGEEDVDYSKKTIADLRDLLNAKGIPFNKSDKKSVLLSLLRATA
jgi:hypothetical protein